MIVSSFFGSYLAPDEGGVYDVKFCKSNWYVVGEYSTGISMMMMMMMIDVLRPLLCTR